jgi:general secretion pathway protein G
LRAVTGHKRKNVAFVEILFVVVIVGLLMILEIPNPDHKTVNTKKFNIDAVTEIRLIEYALDLYYRHNGFYPTTDQGLVALVLKPTTDPQPENYPEGGYLKKVPLDPWKNPFIYRSHGGKGLIDIISCGSDGEEGTDDDITNRNKTP